jgi:hypothetical protein
MQEEWKDIIGYEGYYQISNLGRVKFLERKLIGTCGKFSRTTVLKEKIHRFQIFGMGYYATYLTINKVTKSKYIHRLIAIHFIDNPHNLPFVNHIDGNKLNNAIENLEWVSNRENVCHGKKNIKKSSQYSGVSWQKDRNKWKSQIYHNGKVFHLGRFDTEEEAHNARVKYEQENNIENKYL